MRFVGIDSLLESSLAESNWEKAKTSVLPLQDDVGGILVLFTLILEGQNHIL